MVKASRNTLLVKGLNRHSRSAMFSKRFAHVYKDNKTKTEKRMAVALKEKVVGGDNNGGKRMVRTKKMVCWFYQYVCKRVAYKMPSSKLSQHKNLVCI